jgi:hypothetical protein
MPKKKSSRQKQTKKMKAKRPRVKSSARTRKAASVRRPLRSKGRSKVRRKRGVTVRVDSIAAQNEPRAQAAGQSGDNARLTRVARADSQSVKELADEGQAFESEVLSGVEEAEDTEGEVRTHEVPEDDVPSEYDGDR